MELPMWRYDDSYILLKMIVFKWRSILYCFIFRLYKKSPPLKLYKKKHDTKISMVGDTLLLVITS